MAHATDLFQRNAGVDLAAIQRLNQKVEDLKAEYERLASELEAIKQHLGL